MDVSTIDTSENVVMPNPDDVINDIFDAVLNGDIGTRDYCAKDPFGTKRYKTTPKERSFLCQNRTVTLAVFHIVIAAAYEFSPEDRKTMFDDVSDVANAVAAKYGARVLVNERQWLTKNAVNESNQNVVTVVVPFEIQLFHTPYSFDKTISDEKIIWDAYCRRVNVTQNVHYGRRLFPSDFGKEYKHARKTCQIAGVDLKNPERRVSVVRYSQNSKPEATTVDRVELGRILYVNETEDLVALAAEKTAEEARLFNADKKLLRMRLDASGIDVTYREVFSLGGSDYMLTGIQPRAKRYTFSALCLDETGPRAGKTVKFTYDEVIDEIFSERCTH